ncbi:ABC transporter permease [Mesorhizobium sp. M0047]|uniref:ABC transporter permease n=1 Tax=Mesorhizobium sp. M0047 TaxID=2956859 RepID=UPI003338527B
MTVPSLQNSLNRIGPVLVLMALVAGFYLLNQRFISWFSMSALLENAAVACILAVGLTFVVLQGSIDLSLEGVVSATGMIVSLLVANSASPQNLGLGGIGLALACGLAFGLLNGILFVGLRIPSLIVTIGTWFALLGLAALLFPGTPPVISDPLLIGIALTKIGGLSIVVYLAMLVIAGAVVVERHTRFGRICRAIGADETALKLAGVNTSFFKIAAFAVCGLLAGLAGILSAARLGYGEPIAGQGLAFPAVSAVVIGGTLLSGGRGGVLYSIVGVLILEVIRQGLVMTGFDPLLRQAIEGAALVTAVAMGTWRMRSRLRVVK